MKTPFRNCSFKEGKASEKAGLMRGWKGKIKINGLKILCYIRLRLLILMLEKMLYDIDLIYGLSVIQRYIFSITYYFTMYITLWILCKISIK